MGNKDFTCTCDSKDLLLRVQASKYSQQVKAGRERERTRKETEFKVNLVAACMFKCVSLILCECVSTFP